LLGFLYDYIQAVSSGEKVWCAVHNSNLSDKNLAWYYYSYINFKRTIMSSEKIPQSVSHEEKTPELRQKESLDGAASLIVEWGDRFEMEFKKHDERVESVSALLSDFAKFIEDQSTAMVNESKNEKDFYVVEAIQDLHTFNIHQIQTLRMLAQYFEKSPNVINVLEKPYPWVHAIQEWAESFLDESDRTKYTI
jgi:hypothetical protein